METQQQIIEIDYRLPFNDLEIIEHKESIAPIIYYPGQGPHVVIKREFNSYIRGPQDMLEFYKERYLSGEGPLPVRHITKNGNIEECMMLVTSVIHDVYDNEVSEIRMTSAGGI